MTASIHVFTPIPDLAAAASGLPPEFQPMLQTLSAVKQTVDLLTGITPGYSAVTVDQVKTVVQSQSQTRPTAMGTSMSVTISGTSLVYAEGADYQKLWQDVAVLFSQVHALQAQVNSLITNLKS